MNYIKFPALYDEQILRAELGDILKENWPLHFNTKDYNGDWRSIALRSATGSSQDIYAHAGASFQNTPVLEKMSYVKSILDSWLCEKETVRLLSLAPHSSVLPHKDQGCSYSDGIFRIHIPIITNPDVWFTINGEQLHLRAGECWYMDFSTTHSILNNGDTARVHLIIDGIRNEWTDQLFTAQGYNLSAPTYDDNTKASMIAELERMDTDTARALIAQLKAAK